MAEKTPICRYVDRYVGSDVIRAHMPGHKGKSFAGFEERDITEIPGADSLYEADGIIRESEALAGKLFGSHTFYSTEGSSHAIRAMLHLLRLYAAESGKKPVVAAARNAHKAFLSGAVLSGLTVRWIPLGDASTYLSCTLTPAALDAFLSSEAETPAAVYLTSPDYLGHTLDIGALSAVCHRHGVLLFVDNAHGAYLKFVPGPGHPMDLGADLCCDSAHKTLPVLTGGAFLHVSPAAPPVFREQAKRALSLFGSASPSYLILYSLDNAIGLIMDGYDEAYRALAREVASLKAVLAEKGFALVGNEPLKLSLSPGSYGYTGAELAAYLRERGIEVEFADPDFTVLMLTPALSSEELSILRSTLLSVPRLPAKPSAAPRPVEAEAVLSPGEALFSPSETVPVRNALGRILATPSVGCPPAVPILICGERINDGAVEAFLYYGVEECAVVKAL